MEAKRLCHWCPRGRGSAPADVCERVAKVRRAGRSRRPLMTRRSTQAERFDPNRFEPGREEHHKHPRVYPAGIGPADQPSVSRAGILDTPQARIPRGPRPRYDWQLPRQQLGLDWGKRPRNRRWPDSPAHGHYPRGAEFLAGRMSSQDQLRRQPHPRCLIACACTNGSAFQSRTAS